MQHRLPDILSCRTQWVGIFSAPAVSLKYGFLISNYVIFVKYLKIEKIISV